MLGDGGDCRPQSPGATLHGRDWVGGSKEALAAARRGSERQALQRPWAERRSGQGRDARSLAGAGEAEPGGFKQRDAECVEPEGPVGRPRRACHGERPCGSCPWEAADWSGAEKERPETREEAQARKRGSREGHSRPGHWWWEQEKAGEVGADGSAQKFASAKLRKARTGAPEAKPDAGGARGAGSTQSSPTSRQGRPQLPPPAPRSQSLAVAAPPCGQSCGPSRASRRNRVS